MMIIYTIVQLYSLDSVQVCGCIIPDRFGRFYLCTVFIRCFFWQSVQLVPVYCLCRLVIGVLRLPLCVYVLFYKQMPKSVIIAFCALTGILLLCACNNAVADCSLLPELLPGLLPGDISSV